MQSLKVYQSLWGMELRSPHSKEPTPAEHFRRIADAGFDGVCIDPSAAEVPQMMPLLALYKEHDLECMVNAFPYSPDDMQVILKMAKDFDASVVNVISGVMPLRPEDAVALVRRWMEEAASLELPLLFETHRDSLLNDLFYTVQLMALVPEMRLCADLSHFVVERELRWPVPPREAQMISSVLDRSDCFQGRIASREQVQIQIDFPQHEAWVTTFRTWWKEGMRAWRKRAADNATLIFLCELGPPPYAITDGEQRELSDRWQEALQIRSWVQQSWAELDAEL